MWKPYHKESWALKNWCFRTVVLEKTLESPLDNKKTEPLHSKGNQPWRFIGRTDAEAPILWQPDAKSWLIRRDLDAGKTEGTRRRWQRMRWLNDITDSMGTYFSKLQEIVKDRGAWRATVPAVRLLALSDWRTTITWVQHLRNELNFWLHFLLDTCFGQVNLTCEDKNSIFCYREMS